VDVSDPRTTMSSVLVIGADGLLGRHLYRRLETSARVVGASRRTGLDLSRAEPFAAFDDGRFDFVFNCAVAYDGRALDDLVAVNALGAERAARFALQHGAHLVHASTTSTLGVIGEPYFGPYGMTKRLGDELVAHATQEAGRPASVLRFSQLYDSEGASRHSQPMLFRLIDQIRTQGYATVFGSHDPLRNYLHVDDAVTIMIRAAEQKLPGIWYAAHPESVSVSELAGRIAALLGKPAELRWLADRPSLADIRIPSSEARALYERLGWSPQVSLTEGLTRLLRGC
jgi:nucleoside-diphosphate-sugar epimerase